MTGFSERARVLADLYGPNPQLVGRDDDEDEFGDLVCEVADALGVDVDDDPRFLAIDRAVTESGATTMLALILEAKEALER